MNKKPEKMDFKNVDFSDPKILESLPYRRRRCPIIVTLADPQITPIDIQRFLEAGMNVVKFKMSYNTMGDKARLIGKLDKAARACCEKYFVNDWPVATCVELKTCIVKTGMLETENDFIELNEGKEVLLTCNIKYYNQCNEDKIFVDNYYMSIDYSVGTEISIDADEILLQCTQIVDEKCIKCVVTKGGKLTNIRNLCARDTKHSRPYVSKNDLSIVKFALDYQVDMIIINYVRHVDTLIKIRQFIGKKVKRPLLLSGICTEQGLENFDDILKESDGIILSREYLTYELQTSKRYTLPRIQKWMGAKCLQAGKPLYISGIFQNALVNGSFTYCEISDVNNATLDGASGFLLSDGLHPDFILDVLNAMNELCYALEPLVTSKTNFWRITEEPKLPLNAAEAAVMSCAAAANQSNASLVIIPTITGKTIKALHLMRLSCIIITLSLNNRVTRQLHTYRGVFPILYLEYPNKDASIDERVNFGIEYAVKRAWVAYGDTYVTLQRGSEASSYCDTIRIWKVAMSRKALVECADDNGHDTDET